MCFSSETLQWDLKHAKFIYGECFFITGSLRVFEFNGKLIWYDLGFGLIAWDDPSRFYSEEKEIPLRLIEIPKQQTNDSEVERCFRLWWLVYSVFGDF